MHFVCFFFVLAQENLTHIKQGYFITNGKFLTLPHFQLINIKLYGGINVINHSWWI